MASRSVGGGWLEALKQVPESLSPAPGAPPVLSREKPGCEPGKAGTEMPSSPQPGGNCLEARGSNSSVAVPSPLMVGGGPSQGRASS